MNRAERRRLERENKSQLIYEENMVKWARNLTTEQKRAINIVIDEHVKEAYKLLFEIFESSLNIYTDNSEKDIDLIMKSTENLLTKFKYSKEEIKDMNGTQAKKIEEECNSLMDSNLEPAEAIDLLHSKYPNIKSNDLVKIYKKVRAEFLKPTVEVDMDIELKEFDEKMEKAELKKKLAREKKRAEKEAKKEETETMSNSTKTKFKVVEKTIKLESELGNYTVSKDKISTDCINGVMTTFTSKDEAKKLIGKLLDKLMDLDKEIEEIWNTYVEN